MNIFGDLFLPRSKSSEVVKVCGLCSLSLPSDPNWISLPLLHSLSFGAGAPLVLGRYSEESSFLLPATFYQPNLLCKFARVAVRKYNRLHCLNDRIVFFHSSGGCKFKIKGPVELEPSDTSLLGVQLSALSLCPPVVFSLC